MKLRDACRLVDFSDIFLVYAASCQDFDATLRLLVQFFEQIDAFEGRRLLTRGQNAVETL